MKKIVSMMLFICLMIGTAYGYTLTVNGFSWDNVDSERRVKVNTVDRRGYDFLGWEVISNNITLDAPTRKNISFSMPEADVELQSVYALKTFTIRYDANGGSNPPESQTKTYGQTLTLTTDVPTRTNYEFLGWATNSSSTSINYAKGARFNVEANMVLYAVWKSKTYTVTYNANGGSGAPGSQIKTAGTALTLSNTEPQRSGYAFLGWATDSTATSATYIKGGSYTADANITLYAVWSFYNYSINTSPVEYAFTFKDAVELASTGNTITLRTNTTDTGNATIPTGKTITLDLNGNTLSTSNKLVEVKGTLTIADSQSGGKISSTSTNNPIEVEGTLNITGGTISAESSTNAIYGGESSTITLGTNDGTINTTLPSITGSERGILSLGTAVNYYDGVTNGIHATIVTPTGKFYAELNDGKSSLVDPYVTTNLVSYYEGKYNSGANKYNSTIKNWIDLKGNTNAVLYNTTISDKALVFDGSKSWVSYGLRDYTNPTFEIVLEWDARDFSAQELLLSNADQYVGVNLAIYKNATSGTGPSFRFQTADDDLGNPSADASDIVEDGVKYHILGTYDGSNLKLYINGVKAASFARSTAIKYSTKVNSDTGVKGTNLVTGANPQSTTTTPDDDGRFKGKVYMVRLYKGSLTDTQAKQNYNASMIKDPIDIHTGGTAANDGVCSVCSKQYLTVNGNELIVMDGI